MGSTALDERLPSEARFCGPVTFEPNFLLEGKLGAGCSAADVGVPNIKALIQTSSSIEGHPTPICRNSHMESLAPPSFLNSELANL